MSTNSNGSSHVSFTPLRVPASIRFRYERRPFLHIIVLFATDNRVVRYAKEVQSFFIENGIDVFLQSKVANDLYIKTESLAEIINSSKSDFLAVLGDKNVKNRTVQGRQRGKLIEMKLDELGHHIWGEWPNKAKILENEDIPVDPEDLSPSQIELLMEHYFNLRHVTDRMDKVNLAIKELKEYRKGTGFENLSKPIVDERLAGKVTATQKQLIRLHQQLAEAVASVDKIPLMNRKTPNNSGKGQTFSGNYTPTPLVPGISEAVRDRLVSDMGKLMERIENQGDQLLEFGSPLWSAYADTLASKSDDSEGESPRAISESSDSVTSDTNVTTWSCTACTYVNRSDSAACEMCGSLKSSNSSDPTQQSEWNLTGSAGKKQRKKQREKEKKDQQEAEEKKKVDVPKQPSRPEPKYKVAKEPPVKSFPHKQTRSPMKPPYNQISNSQPQQVYQRVNGSERSSPNEVENNRKPPVSQNYLSNQQQQQPSQQIFHPQPTAPSQVVYGLAQMTLSSQNNSFSQPQPSQAPKYMPPQLQAFSNTAQSTTTFDNSPSSFSNQKTVPPFQNYFSPGLWTDSLFPFGVQNYNAPPQNPQYNNWFSPFQTPNFQPSAQVPFYQPENNFDNGNYVEQEIQHDHNGNSKISAMRPCSYCGEESYMECNHCAKIGLSTYFCSPEHQSLIWKDHLEYHKQQNFIHPPSNK